jgi:hypothetical protein
MEMTQAAGRGGGGGGMWGRNNVARESCREQVVMYEQMLVFLTGMFRNFKMQKKSL